MPIYPITTVEASQLPNEILELIFLLLPRHSQLSCLTVCRGWFSTALRSIYSSISDSAVFRKCPSIMPFEKYSYLIRDICWSSGDSSDPCLNAAKQFLFQSGQSPSNRGKKGLQLHSLTYHGLTGHRVEPFLMKLLAHQPTLTKVCLVGSIGIRARLPLDIILECLPYLAHLEVSQYFCQLSDISHWAVQDCRRQWNRSQTLIKDEMVTETIEINTVESAAILTGTVAAVRPPFALRVLRFSEAFRYLTDYEIFFGALPNLVSLDLHTEVLLSAWRNIEKHLDTSNTPNPWSDAVAARFSKSLIRKCPKLNRILLKDKFSVAMLDLQYNGAGAQSNHDDSRAQFEVSLPKIMRDFRECTFRQSRKSLNWMIQTCGSGLKELNISCSSQEVGTSNTPGDNINSRDLQNILESCPNLTMLMAGGRVLHVRDMAPLSSFLDVSPPHAIRHRDSAQDLPTRTESKPWACTRTLERLEIGIMAETDDPSEHEKAWIQLGQIKNCTAIELSKTNLIPRLSHGLGMLRDIKPLYTFLIKQWEMSESAEVCTDENRPEDETKKRRATLLDSETVAWIAKHWKNLLVLKLDTGGIEELKEEMRALVEREKKDGRMRIVRLLLT